MSMTLWMLQIGMERYVRLVCFYAVDEQDAWKQIVEWANKEEVTLPEDIQLTVMPRGFQLNTSTLPGHIDPDASVSCDQRDR